MGAGNVYEIKITKACRKEIERAPLRIRQAIERAILKIAVAPCSLPGVKPLTGEWVGFYRYRIGNYRMIYQVDHEIITVFIVAFGPRGDVYK